MKKAIRPFLTALRFLTILPLPWLSHDDSECFPDSVKFFAIVGLLIGLAGSIITYLLSTFLPQAVLSCVLILYLSAISGFLHLDGVADTSDGFFSSRPKEKILEIMRDSRTGAMGVTALVFLILFKFCALISLPYEKLVLAVFFIPLAGRCAIVFTMNLLPYAREDGGLGLMFYKNRNREALWVSLFVFLLAGGMVNFVITFFSLLTLLVVVILFGTWCNRTIGGITGDTLGAVCETAETAVAVALSIYFYI